MKGELHTAKSFRKDYKKLSKTETDETDLVIKKLLNGAKNSEKEHLLSKKQAVRK